jgi:hypothetical protein
MRLGEWKIFAFPVNSITVMSVDISPHNEEAK